MASLTTHPPTVDTPSLTPRQPLSTKLSGYATVDSHSGTINVHR